MWKSILHVGAKAIWCYLICFTHSRNVPIIIITQLVTTCRLSVHTLRKYAGWVRQKSKQDNSKYIGSKWCSLCQSGTTKSVLVLTGKLSVSLINLLVGSFPSFFSILIPKILNVFIHICVLCISTCSERCHSPLRRLSEPSVWRRKTQRPIPGHPGFLSHFPSALVWPQIASSVEWVEITDSPSGP